MEDTKDIKDEHVEENYGKSILEEFYKMYCYHKVMTNIYEIFNIQAEDKQNDRLL